MELTPTNSTAAAAATRAHPGAVPHAQFLAALALLGVDPTRVTRVTLLPDRVVVDEVLRPGGGTLTYMRRLAP